MLQLKIYVQVFVIGAILGMAYDSLHVHFGILTYSHPHFMGESFWVFVEFGLAAIAYLTGMRQIEKRNRKYKPTTLLHCAIQLILLLIGYLITCISSNPVWLTSILLVIPGMLTILLHLSKIELILILITITIGPLCEWGISRTGFFEYKSSEFIPLWLPILYITAAGAFIEICKLFLPKLAKT